jgi:hypothetical protein
MIIFIEMPPDLEKILLKRGRLSGRDLATYVKGIIQDHIDYGDAITQFDDSADDEVTACCV